MRPAPRFSVAFPPLDVRVAREVVHPRKAVIAGCHIASGRSFQTKGLDVHMGIQATGKGTSLPTAYCQLSPLDSRRRAGWVSRGDTFVGGGEKYKSFRSLPG